MVTGIVSNAIGAIAIVLTASELDATVARVHQHDLGTARVRVGTQHQSCLGKLGRVRYVLDVDGCHKVSRDLFVGIMETVVGAPDAGAVTVNRD